MDRPDICLFPSENVLLDPLCDWTNPAQTSQYVHLRTPSSVEDSMVMIRKNVGSGNTAWLDIDESDLMRFVDDTGPMDAIAPRVAREGGKDPLALVSGRFGRVWLTEVFMRVRGEELVFWTVNNQLLLSEPMKVREAYPALDGERPIVMGYGTLESHRVFPMSPVESWQQMQMEINDQVNLRLDHLKQVVSPQIKVVRGRQIDLTQVQRRGPNGIIMVQAPEDVEFQQVPDVPQSAFVENQQLNQDFDDLAGAFNPVGTEQSNAGASETFGGLSLIANGAATMGKYDLTVVTETWIEPVITQILKLEENYESDATLLTIAGQKAKLFERFGVSEITDEMLKAETTLTVKIGVGAAAQPAERIMKLSTALNSIIATLTPFYQAKVIQPPVPNVKEIVDTYLGAADFPDGGDRFFIGLDEMQGPNAPPQPPPPPDPKMAAVQQKAQSDQVNAQLKAAELQLRQKEIAVKHLDNMTRAQNDEANRAADIAKTHMKTLAEIGHAMIQSEADRQKQIADRDHDHNKSLFGNFHDLVRSKLDRDAKLATAAAGFAHQQQMQATDHAHQADMQDAALAAQSEQAKAAAAQQTAGE
jgi:hypothetical protein